MQTPKNTFGNSNGKPGQADLPNEPKTKKVNSEDDFDEDFDNEPLDDLDYDGVARYDDDDDDDY
jgi:hypothetical protein